MGIYSFLVPNNPLLCYSYVRFKRRSSHAPNLKQMSSTKDFARLH